MPASRTTVTAFMALFGLVVLAQGGAVADSATATIEHDGTSRTLHPAPGQVVEGTTSLEPGRNVTVRLRSAGGAEPFLLTRETTVTESGRYAASFDLRDVDVPGNATASVFADGRRIAGPVEVRIVESGTTSPGQNGFGVALGLLATLVAVLVGRSPGR